MVEAMAIQQRLIDFISDLSKETGVERREIFKVASQLEYGRLPGSDEALAVLKQAQADRLAGKPGIPIEEAIASLESVIDKY